VALLLADQGRLQALLNEPLADPLDGGDADLDGLCDPPISGQAGTPAAALRRMRACASFVAAPFPAKVRSARARRLSSVRVIIYLFI
jgi:hypothetical protein